ncbi:hypothetical protein Salat_1871700 [Sesamum alatum]|uniref:Uncharacterized protein n=1 Tax=Sesamum alatum TaxID=300844 RepID=A0AAE1Y347_9LAMI|nr:hypothetical protein Salat_1871700 [Sesamum alatum]
MMANLHSTRDKRKQSVRQNKEPNRKKKGSDHQNQGSTSRSTMMATTDDTVAGRLQQIPSLTCMQGKKRGQKEEGVKEQGNNEGKGKDKKTNPIQGKNLSREEDLS